ncbi:MAG: hypothetical protein KDC92_07085 [Bacteroidetes bacterium]|nr:hypothetical protein [Bacteroidota bacterium]
MKLQANRYISFALATVFMVSAIGYSVSVHYCLGMVADISLTGKAKPCLKAELPSEGVSIKKPSCCSESYQFAQLLPETDIQKPQVEYVPQTSFLKAQIEIPYGIKSLPAYKKGFKVYPPPEKTIAYFKLYESFRC